MDYLTGAAERMKQGLLLQILVMIPVFAMQETAQGMVHGSNTANAGKWEKVSLVYFHDFPYHQHLKPRNLSTCFFALSMSSAFGHAANPVWRCREYIILLRPETLINQWKREENENGVFHFTLPDSGIYNISVHIESVSPIDNTTLKINSDLMSRGIITGIFLRHSINVRTYTFKSPVTGRVSKVNATPEHPFYVKSLHRWMPLRKITASMILMDNHANPVMLQCADHRQHHCGVPLHPGEISAIYNLEVHRKHTYFVGRRSLLVHNCGNFALMSNNLKKPDRLESMLVRKIASPVIHDSLDTLVDDMFKSIPTDIINNRKTELDDFLDEQIKKSVELHNGRMNKHGLLAYNLSYIKKVYEGKPYDRVVLSFEFHDSGYGYISNVTIMEYNSCSCLVKNRGDYTLLNDDVFKLFESRSDHAKDLKRCTQFMQPNLKGFRYGLFLTQFDDFK